MLTRTLFLTKRTMYIQQVNEVIRHCRDFNYSLWMRQKTILTYHINLIMVTGNIYMKILWDLINIVTAVYCTEYCICRFLYKQYQQYPKTYSETYGLILNKLWIENNDKYDNGVKNKHFLNKAYKIFTFYNVLSVESTVHSA